MQENRLWRTRVRAPASQTVNYNGSTNISITPDTGYKIASITDNGNRVMVTNTYVISNVTANHAVVVTFAIVTPIPQSVKQGVLSSLISLRAKVTNKDDGDRLDEAIKHLTNSLSPSLWLDDAHLKVKDGEKVFNEEKDAVIKLLELIKNNKSLISSVSQLQGFIDNIVKADWQLASTAIAGNPLGKEISNALDEMAKSADELAKGNPDNAIEHYKNAWQHAQNGLGWI